MTPQEVQERLKLNQLKDKIWYVVPSCATTGEGLFEGLVSRVSAEDSFRPANRESGLVIEQRQDTTPEATPIDHYETF